MIWERVDLKKIEWGKGEAGKGGDERRQREIWEGWMP